MNNKKKTKTKPVKSSETRASETNQIRQKILELGFPPEDPGVERLFRTLDTFADEGIGQSGRIDSEAFGYRFIFKLSTQPHVISELTVRKLA
jgi:hypothetical protein